MKIFVVGGKSGSGKNEVAKMIEEFYIYKLKKCVTTEFSKYIKLFANMKSTINFFMHKKINHSRNLDLFPVHWTGSFLKKSENF